MTRWPSLCIHACNCSTCLFLHCRSVLGQLAHSCFCIIVSNICCDLISKYNRDTIHTIHQPPLSLSSKMDFVTDDRYFCTLNGVMKHLIVLLCKKISFLPQTCCPKESISSSLKTHFHFYLQKPLWEADGEQQRAIIMATRCTAIWFVSK